MVHLGNRLRKNIKNYGMNQKKKKKKWMNNKNPQKIFIQVAKSILNCCETKYQSKTQTINQSKNRQPFCKS